MSQSNLSLVRFNGGPLDGHEQVVAVPPKELDDVVMLPVGRFLALLHNDRSYERLVNMAVYERSDAQKTEADFHYIGAVSTCAGSPDVGKTPTF